MSYLRVTGGSLKGRKIEVPQGDFEIRPAMDRMRESVFSILGNLNNCSFLDLFSGSGIISIEAASRGANPIDCVERDRAKLTILINNVSICPERVNCHCMPVERFLLRSKKQYDLIFCDPPFPYKHKAEIIELIVKNNLLTENGILAIHYPKENELPESIDKVKLWNQREYGRSIVNFYKNNYSE